MPVRLAGYRIYYGKAAGALTTVISVANPSVSNYVVDNLATGTWYFGVSAVNADGQESPLSNIASKTIT